MLARLIERTLELHQSVAKIIDEGKADPAWIAKLFSFLSDEQLKEAIEHPHDIIGVMIKYFPKTAEVIWEKRDKLLPNIKYITPENILKVLEEYEPNKAEIIKTHPLGRIWLTQQAEQIRAYIEKKAYWHWYYNFL